jgi:hypothetical protein
MKKVFSKITMIMLAMLAFTFTSCEDEEIAQNLAGNEGRIWQGTISKYYQDRWGFSGDHYRTVIEFVGDPWHWTKGTGYEVDYDMNDPYGSYWYSRFDWRVDRGVITLRYADTDYEPVYISDYYLSGNRFEGFMDDGTNSEIKFSLYMIEDFDWDYYNRYSYYDGFYPAPRRMAASKNNTPTDVKAIVGDIDETTGEVKFASKGAFAKKSAAE